MKNFDSVKAVFNSAQTGSQHEEMLFKALDKLAESNETPDEFVKDFLHNLKYCLIVFQKEPAVERMMDFVATYATRESKTQNEVKKLQKQNNMFCVNVYKYNSNLNCYGN